VTADYDCLARDAGRARHPSLTRSYTRHVVSRNLNNVVSVGSFFVGGPEQRTNVGAAAPPLHGYVPIYRQTGHVAAARRDTRYTLLLQPRVSNKHVQSFQYRSPWSTTTPLIAYDNSCGDVFRTSDGLIGNDLQLLRHTFNTMSRRFLLL